MIKKETKEKLESLKKSDVYSLVLFALYNLKNEPKYSTLSELAYILDGKALMDFLSYFGGLTIKIPTARELKLVINGLLLYEYVNLDGIEFNQAIKLLDESEFTQKEIKEVYTSLVGILEKYDFNRG